MTRAELLTIILSAIGILGIPTLVFIVRISRKWTQVEDKLDTIITKEVEAKKEAETKMTVVETELKWMRDKIWQLWVRWGGKR